MAALNKEQIMGLYPRGHNWAADDAPTGNIALKVIKDPTANPDGHASAGAGRHRGPVCVRCGDQPCFDCGMIAWSKVCPDVAESGGAF
jgi:hypothetical protein